LAAVECQESRGDSANWRQAFDSARYQVKVVGPIIRSRVEESDKAVGLPVDRSDIAPLRLVTKHAGIGEILGISSSTMLLADDVVRFATVECILLCDQAILTNGLSSRHDDPAQVSRNIGHRHAALTPLQPLASTSLGEAHEVLDLQVLVQFR